MMTHDPDISDVDTSDVDTSAVTGDRRRRPGTRRRPVNRRRLVVELVGFPFVVVALLWLAQDRLVFLPTHDLPPVHDVLPTGEDVTFTTADGVTQHAWWIPAAAEEPGSDGGRRRAPTVLAFHGNFGTRAGLDVLAAALARRGSNVLLAEYRGFGDVDGSPSEDGLRLDADAALAYVRSRPEVDPGRITYLGYSLGTGVAVALAAEAPPRALILLAPYTSLPAVAWSRLPVLPYDVLMKARFDSGSTIRHVGVPTLIVGGSADSTVPPEHARILFDAAPGEKRLVVIDGADHDLVPPPGRPGPDVATEAANWVAAHG